MQAQNAQDDSNLQNKNPTQKNQMNNKKGKQNGPGLNVPVKLPRTGID